MFPSGNTSNESIVFAILQLGFVLWCRYVQAKMTYFTLEIKKKDNLVGELRALLLFGQHEDAKEVDLEAWCFYKWVFVQYPL